MENNDKKMTVNIYTDGACSGNQNRENRGGYGAVLEYGSHVKELSGGDINTTNNRMELTAVIEALGMLKKDGLRLNIFSDSSYIVNCFRERWFDKWRMNGWHTSGKQPVENRELWERLLELLENQEYDFYLVKGHVNPDHPNTNMQGHYKKFVDKNGPIGYEKFEHAVRMNNRADALANEGIKSTMEV